MIPTSFTSSQSISVAGMGGPYWNGLTNKTYFRVSQIDSLEESWSLDTWHRMDYLLTPNRMDIWLDGVQLSSRSTNAETFVGSVSASALAEVEDAWRVGGKLT